MKIYNIYTVIILSFAVVISIGPAVFQLILFFTVAAVLYCNGQYFCLLTGAR